MNTQKKECCPKCSCGIVGNDCGKCHNPVCKCHTTQEEAWEQLCEDYKFLFTDVPSFEGFKTRVKSVSEQAVAERERELREAIVGMDEQNEVTQAILAGLEYRGFYDAGKYLDGTIWESVTPLLVSLLTSRDMKDRICKRHGTKWSPAYLSCPDCQNEKATYPICGMVSLSGAKGEPLACGFPKGHRRRTHAYATLPTFW